MRTIKNRLTRLFRNQATARRSASRRRFQASIDVLETRQLLAADIAIVQDLNTDPASSLPSYAGNGEAERRFETIGDITYFVASTNGHGEELWKTDGTEEGTVLLKDVRAGNDSSSIRELTNLNGTLVFSAYDRIIGWELWKSDGTESGTVPVKDIKAGGSSSFPFNLYNWNGLLYFAADGGDGDELWVSNGSEAGTYQLKDIYSGSSNSDPADFVAVGNDLFFSARTSAAGRELWKTDGTSAGTELVKDINPGTAHSYPKS